MQARIKFPEYLFACKQLQRQHHKIDTFISSRAKSCIRREANTALRRRSCWTGPYVPNFWVTLKTVKCIRGLTGWKISLQQKPQCSINRISLSWWNFFWHSLLLGQLKQILQCSLLTQLLSNHPKPHLHSLDLVVGALSTGGAHAVPMGQACVWMCVSTE